MTPRPLILILALATAAAAKPPRATPVPTPAERAAMTAFDTLPTRGYWVRVNAYFDADTLKYRFAFHKPAPDSLRPLAANPGEVDTNGVVTDEDGKAWIEGEALILLQCPESEAERRTATPGLLIRESPVVAVTFLPVLDRELPVMRLLCDLRILHGLEDARMVESGSVDLAFRFRDRPENLTRSQDHPPDCVPMGPGWCRMPASRAP